MDFGVARRGVHVVGLRIREMSCPMAATSALLPFFQNVKMTGSMVDGHEVLVRAGSSGWGDPLRHQL